MLHTLLLNSTYECIAFIAERKVFKLLAKDKIEVLSTWEEKVSWGRTKIRHPAVVRLRHHVRWIPRKVRFNRAGVFRRDQHICQYCNAALTPSKLTMDHIIPKARGGDSSWRNCVTACFACNNKKGDKMLDEARMALQKKPTVPQITIYNEYSLMKLKHDEWKDYITHPPSY